MLRIAISFVAIGYILIQIQILYCHRNTTSIEDRFEEWK